MNITAYILAGGKSSRMGSDKGLLFHNGKRLVEHVIDSCRAFTANIVISTRNPEYEYLGYPLVADEIQSVGPIGGIHTALKHSNTENNLFCPCDMPGVDEDVLLNLINAQKGFDAVVAADGNGKNFPVLAIYSKKILPVIEEQIKTGDYKMQHLLGKLNASFVEISNESLLHNVNYPHDLR